MTTEEKTLLMQVLCTMFPYEVILRIDIQPGGYINRKLSDISNITVNEYYKLEQVKPYLRPMSSMTKMEYLQLDNIMNKRFGEALDLDISGRFENNDNQKK